MTTLKETDMGVGYAYNEFADTTAPRTELERLARLVSGPVGEYHYAKLSDDDDDDTPARPCNYLESLDDVLRPQLRQCGSWDQARAVVEMLATQMSQTGWATDKRRATTEEREWAHLLFAASRAKQQLERVPGTCRGCNADPCRCWA